MATEDGYRRIDGIEVGDLVWACNVETGELELKEVLTVYVKENREILHLETSTGNIDTTTNHPFYVPSRGWVVAGDLEIGNEVYAIDGSTSVIIGYWLEVFDTPVTVYNLEVDGFHTYFVGEFGVLVHNAKNYKKDLETARAAVKEADLTTPKEFEDYKMAIDKEKKSVGRGGSDNLTFDVLKSLAEQAKRRGR